MATIDPETGKAVRIFSPRSDRWSDYFRFDSDYVFITALTVQGHATIRLLRVNAPERIAERRLICLALDLRISASADYHP